MAHEVETAMFVGQPAWHGLGTVLNAPPSMEDALRIAGLDWEVELQPLYAARGEEYAEVETGHKAVIRKSDGRTLGVVRNYTPVQNAEGFRPFQPLLDAGLVTLEAAGSLRLGSRVWILAKMTGADAEIVPGDAIRGYLLFFNSHDGSLAVSYQETAVRVVCANTLGMAIQAGDAGREARLQFRHSLGVLARVDDLTGKFRAAATHFQETIACYRLLAGISCPDPERYFRSVLDLPVESVGDASVNAYGGVRGVLHAETMEEKREQGKRQMSRLMELHEDQPGREYAEGSMWHAYNTLTYWMDHDRGRTSENRLNASWFGWGKKFRADALRCALAEGRD